MRTPCKHLPALLLAPWLALAPAGAASGSSAAATVLAGADLAPVVTSDGPAAVGEPTPVRIRVHNVGTVVGAGRTTVDFNYPFRRVASAEGPGWTCDQQVARCTHDGSVLPGGSLPDLLAQALDPLGAANAPVVDAGVLVTNDSDLDPQSNRAGVQAARPDSTAGPVAALTPPRVLPVLATGTPYVSGGVGRIGVRVRNPDPGPVAGPVTVEAFEDSPQPSLAGSGGEGWTCSRSACTHPGPVPGGAALPEVGLVLESPFGAPSGSRTVRVRASLPGSTSLSYAISLPVVRDYVGLAARVSAFTPSPDGSWTVTLDRDARGVSAATAALGDGTRVVPSVATCAPGPCSTGPVRTIVLRPTAPLPPGSYTQAAVVPTVTQEAQFSSFTRVQPVVQDHQAAQAWAAVADPAAVGGRYAREKLGGSAWHGSSVGTSFRYWWVAGPDHGRVRVYVDGRAVTDVDQWAPTRTSKRSTVVSGLTPGFHTVQVLVLGTKRSASKSTYATVDAISATSASCLPRDATCDPDARGSYAWRYAALAVASDQRVVTAAAPTPR